MHIIFGHAKEECTRPQLIEFDEVQSRIDEQITAFERLLANDLPAFNTRLTEAKLGAVLVN